MRCTAGRCGSRSRRRSRSSPCSASALHQFVIRPVLTRRADQPAAGHRRRAVLPAGRGHARVRGRVQEPGRAACRRWRSGEMFLSVARLIAFLVALAGMIGDVSVPHAHLPRHRDPRDLAGPRDHAADGRESEPHLPDHLGARAARWPDWPRACWCCSTTSTRRSDCRSARSPSWCACSAGWAT